MKFKILFIFSCFLLSCTQKESKPVSLLNYIPENTAIIVKINQLSSLKNELTNTPLISKFKKTNLYDSITQKIKALEYINPISTSLLLVTNKNKSSEFAFITKDTTDIIKFEKGLDIQTETISHKNWSYTLSKINNTTFYSSSINNTVIISSSISLLEDCINPKNTSDIVLEKLFNASSSKKTASIFINTHLCDSLFSSELQNEPLLKPSLFSDWIAVDLNTGQDYIQLNGIATAKDSTKKYINLFKNTSALKNATALFAPKKAAAIVSYTFDNYSTFKKNQHIYNTTDFIVSDSTFKTVEEIGLIYLNNDKSVVLNTYGSETITDFLNKNKKQTFTYQGNEITELTNTSFLNNYFNPLIKDFSANYYTILENAFVFSTKKENIQTIISNYKNGTTFNTSSFFKSTRKTLATESNFLFIANHNNIESIINDAFSKSIAKDFKKMGLSDYAFATQFISDQNFYHINSIIKKVETEEKSNSISPLYTIQLENDIASNPQFVTNHQTKKKEIIVQDNANNLYLISSEGKILWKKELNSPIQGKVKQVDLYKNGKLQFAFTTNNQFLILDRNGEEIAPFNKTYDGGNLNELAVFDYENNKDYRFVITQGTTIFMYNNKAKIVDGFKYTSSKSGIIDAPQHFRINRKDYLVFKLKNNELKILNRIGKSRIKVNQKINFSNNPIKLYKNKFITTDNKGVLYQINEKGSILKTNFNLNEYHGLDATSKTLVFMNDNTLSIKGKKVNLDLGVYSKPQIFYINNKIYISVTDIQNQKIYLFDSNAKSIPNFPVFGNSIIDFEDINRDKKLEFVTKDTDNSLIVYKMN